MNKIINIGLTALFACFVAACENDIDNYDAPNGARFSQVSISSSRSGGSI